MNVCESDKLGFALSTYGASRVNCFVEADVVILNACCVRSQAEQKAFSYLGRLEEFKQEKSNVKIVVVGCMAERLGAKIKKRFKSVDLIIGAKNSDNIALKIMNLYGNNTLKQENMKVAFDIVKYVIIMRGCNNYCSYCIVPFVRGSEKSLSTKDIVNECILASENGAKEVILLGQNVNSYLYKDINFTSLIRKIVAIKNIERVRFMTNHPKDLNDDLINVMATETKVCSHIHLPMQSASNKILKAMNRKYTYEHYIELINKLRVAIPDINITTDIIVGFPGETEKDFEETLKAIKNIRFGWLYVFKYSPRPSTKAAEMVDDVTLIEKKRRHSIILEEANKISIEIVSSMVGSLQTVLAEKIEKGVIEAKTKSGRKVFISGGAEKYLGSQFNVYIKEARINSLLGCIV
jgi:tRNA-2-methylthio-N6-dimethylallyladenosine synthase